MLQWHELTVCRHFRHVTRCWRTGYRLLFLSITTWCRGIPAKRHNGNLSNTFPTEHKQNLLGWRERVVHIQVDKLSSLFQKRGTYDSYQNKQTFAHLAPVPTNMNNVHLSQKFILNVFQEKINTNELTFRNLEKLFLIFLVSEQLLDPLEGLLTKTLHTKN